VQKDTTETEQYSKINDISSEIMEARKQWNTTINVLNDKNYQSGILHAVKITFHHKGKTKTFARFLKICKNSLPANLYYEKC